MTFVLVGQEDSSSSEASAEDLGSPVDLPRLSGGGHYHPAAAVTGAYALHWMPFAAAVSTARAMLGASHEDLRLRSHQLSLELSGAFFDRQAAAARPYADFCGAARFPEDGLYVCADLPPLGPALQDVQRALMQVAVKEASHGPCDWYFDTVGRVMWLLVVGDDGDGRGPQFSTVPSSSSFSRPSGWSELQSNDKSLTSHLLLRLSAGVVTARDPSI